jgi:hypothetical protein
MSPAAQDRATLEMAIRRYGGYDLVQDLGFIPFTQWNYFCRFYLLLKVLASAVFGSRHTLNRPLTAPYQDLKAYLNEHDEGQRLMPTLKEIREAGYERLYSEIARNGGRKLVAARIGLPLKPNSTSDHPQIGCGGVY